MYRLLRKLLFLLDPEAAHHLTFRLLRLPGVAKLVRSGKSNHDPRLEKKVFGLNFPNPVGLAAGLDKDAIAFEELAELGFVVEALERVAQLDIETFLGQDAAKELADFLRLVPIPSAPHD